jgi:hypothetical protein
MRKIIESQMKLGEVDISEIEFDLRSRDEIPKLLMGLQYIYCNPDIKNKVFEILEKIVPNKVNSKVGRQGMNLWNILVFGTLRLNCNWDYDKVQEMANNHMTLRQMVGIGMMNMKDKFPLQTLRDNVCLLTPEILDEINQVVIKAGHNLVKKKEEKLKGKCDSFVLETDVHYPTDINLLFDAVRKIINLLAASCTQMGISDLRQHRYLLRKAKSLFRRAQNVKSSKSKDEKKIAIREKFIIETHHAYISYASTLLVTADKILEKLKSGSASVKGRTIEIEKFIKHAQRQIDQIRRRVINGEKIPHAEKVFSLFEEHTEWICKGKAGISQELGLKVCVLEDQYGFILNHKVMQKQTDEQIAISIIKETKDKFSDLSLCSFDKGFYSQENKIGLAEILEKVVLPKKGRLSKADKEIEQSEEFIKTKRKHSAVESGINALENHGLDQCLDNGIVGFKRYVSLAIVARNIQILRNIVQQKNQKKLKKAA